MLDFTYWEGCDPGFLGYEEHTPARAMAAKFIAEASPSSLIEVGFGGAQDYKNHFSHMGCSYLGIDGCQRFVDAAAARYPGAHWQRGTFDDLRPLSADAVYTMATLEHQPDLDAPLRSLLAAARRIAVVVWYRAPSETEQRERGADGVYYCTWRRDDVNRIATEMGWPLIETISLPPRAVDVFRR